MHIGKGALFNKGKRLRKLLLRFPGKSGDQIGGNGRVIEIGPQQSHRFVETRRVILAVHALECGIAAALHGQVEMRTEPWQLAGALTEIFGNRTGFQTAQTQAHIPCCLGNGFQQVDQRGTVLEIVTVGGNLDTGNDDLAVTLPVKLLCLRHGDLHGQRAHTAACVGNDAVSAEVDTAVFHLQHSAGTGCHAAGRQHLKLAALEGIIHQLHGCMLRCSLFQQVEKGHAVSGTGNQVDAQ